MSRSTRKHLLSFGLLLLATLTFFWPLVVGRGWHIPQGGGDLVSFLWPTYRYASHALRQGELPLWNPYLYAGAPYAADNQSGLFYPPNLLLTLLPDVPYRIMEWLVALHIYLGGIGMYLLVILSSSSPPSQYMGVQRRDWGPLIAAMAFQFSSVFVTHVGHLNIVATSAYLPWALLCLHQIVTTRQARWAVALAGCLALAMLAGHAQMALIVGVAVGLGGLWELYLLLRSNATNVLRVALLLALSLVLTFGLTAIALLPATDMTPHTHRADLSHEAAARYSLPPIGLSGVLSPLLFGRGPRGFWPAWDRVELGYAGMVTLFLAGLAVGNTRTRHFAYLLGGFGLIVALGKYTPLHSWLYEHVPGFGQLRVPARFILLTDFALAYLAGIGLQDWIRGLVSTRRVITWSAVLALATAVTLPMAWGAAATEVNSAPPEALPLAVIVTLLVLGLALVTTWQRWCAPGITLLLAIELIALGAWVEVENFDPNAGYHAGPAVAFLQAQTRPFRIDVAALAWQPDSPATHHLEAVSGIHNPLALADYDNYYWSVGHRGSPLYNFLNTQFVVADKGTPAADSTFVPVFDKDPHVDVYLNTNAQPRITLIYNPIFVADQVAAFESVHSPNFDPEHEVVLEEGEPLPPSAAGERKLYYTQYTNHQQTIFAMTPSPAYLVFSEVWYPGWNVFLDGDPVELLRANYAFRAVYLPAGDHTVTMRFAPQIWTLGYTITSITLIGLATIGGLRLVRWKLQD